MSNTTTGPDAAARERWLKIAEDAKPRLHHREARPLRTVEGILNPKAHQHWEMFDKGLASSVCERTWRGGESFILDFGMHIVGHVAFDLSAAGIADAPVRLQLVFGEIATEVCEPFDPYSAQMSRAWLQDETLTIDVLPQRVELPRRYAFRYLKITVASDSPAFSVRFDDFLCRIVSSANPAAVAPLPPGVPEDLRLMDEVSRRTLANCMQTVFEDGPKRDRRLWIDLAVCAPVNHVTFRQFDLTKRCLYLFAALANQEGIISACVYEAPHPHAGNDFILDYTALFAGALLDYAETSGDWSTADDLWPVVWRQLEMLQTHVDERGLFADPGNWWIFIDWEPRLHKETAMQGVILRGLQDAVTLAEKLKDPARAAALKPVIEKMKAAARDLLFCAEKQLFVSGPEKQIAWASQVWMVLGRVVEKEDAARLLRTVRAMSGALKPINPGLYHLTVEALWMCGLEKEGLEVLRSYWGGMIERGATTFWEIHDPERPFLSPYGNHLVNSYCHTWSCSPALFIRDLAWRGFWK
jgi:alpha-L-rhamnosidase